MSKEILRRETTVDLCIVGGGVAGLCAALAAARHGIRVALMQDRPVLGGNASSEIRMWICGANGNRSGVPHLRETGILEELELENFHCNYPPSFAVWDSVLYGKARVEKNLTLLLNCSCADAKMENGRIVSVTGWQTTTQTWQTVKADYFADCSGDSILAPLTGAQFRVGREARSEFNESLEPEVADEKTMGMSCLLQVRETDRPQKFVAPSWATKIAERNQFRFHQVSIDNFWWIEVGGEDDSIADTEELRDELIAFAYGVWDNIKNNGDNDSANWVLDWIGFLPGKRESRRYVGDHLLTQNDIQAGGHFDDLVAYGGWPLDDHDPRGIRRTEKRCLSEIEAIPVPYGIPYRSLYSVNIENLFFAGRNISATHAAMSSTRVMATCAVEGQAIGTAAAIAKQYGLSPRGVYEQKLEELQDLLRDDDCYLPFSERKIPDLTAQAALEAGIPDAENLRSGIDRPIGETDNGCFLPLGSPVTYRFARPERVTQLRLVFDSDLNRDHRNMPARFYLNDDTFTTPKTLTKAFKLTGTDAQGNAVELFETGDNYQRFVRIPVDAVLTSVTFTPLATHGAETAHVFAFDVR